MSDIAVSFPRGGDAAGGEEGPGRPPIFRVRVWIQVLFRFEIDSSFLFFSPKV
jgi:hypothetical protein